MGLCLTVRESDVIELSGDIKITMKAPSQYGRRQWSILIDAPDEIKIKLRKASEKSKTILSSSGGK